MNRPTILRLTLSCTNGGFMPRSFDPPQPKHLFVGFGANVIVSVKFSQPLRFLTVLLPLFDAALQLGHRFTQAQRGSARRAARLADACASPRAKYPPTLRRHARFAFRPSRRSRDAECWAADSARRNSGRARRELRVLLRESRARWRQSPGAVRATNTFRHRDTSSACPRACACEAPRPRPAGAKRRPCAFWRDAWWIIRG